MGYETIALAVSTLIFALIILWETSLSMISKRNIIGFLPFFFMGVVLIVYAAFILFEFFFVWSWFFLEFLILIVLIWIFIIIRRKNGIN